MVIRADADEVIGRKGERGVFVIPTKQAILVGEVSFSCLPLDLVRVDVRGEGRRR